MILCLPEDKEKAPHLQKDRAAPFLARGSRLQAVRIFRCVADPLPFVFQ